MQSNLTREQALALLKTYNKEPFHIQHALTVEGGDALVCQRAGLRRRRRFLGHARAFCTISTLRNWPEEHCSESPGAAARRPAWARR